MSRGWLLALALAIGAVEARAQEAPDSKPSSKQRAPFLPVADDSKVDAAFDGLLFDDDAPENDGNSKKDDARGTPAAGTTRTKSAKENSPWWDRQVRSRGDLAGMVFQGATTFTAEQLRWALEVNLDYQVASTPTAGLLALERLIADRLMSGYRRAGFPDVFIKASYDPRYHPEAKGIFVEIQEGPRYRAGEIVVEGADKISSERLIAWMMRPQVRPAAVGEEDDDEQTRPPVWQPGTPAPFDRYARGPLRAALKEAFAEQGFYFTKFDAQVVPDAGGDTAQLRVTIVDEGRPSVIDRIEVSGLEKNTREQLLEYLDVRPGMRYSRELHSRLERRLWDSARFWEYKIELPLPADEQAPFTLGIHVTEFDKAPPLGGEFSPKEKALLALCRHFTDFERWEDDVVITGQLGDDDDRVTFRCVISPAHGHIFSIRGLQAKNSTMKQGFDYTLAATTERFGIYAERDERKFEAAHSSQGLKFVLARLPYRDEETEDFTSKLVLGFAVTTRRQNGRPIQIEQRFAPVTFVCIAHWGDHFHCTIDEGVLSVKSPEAEFELRADAVTGRLFSVVLGESPALTINFEPQAFKREMRLIDERTSAATNVYDEHAPFTSFVRFAIDMWTQHHADATDAAPGSDLDAEPLRRLLVQSIVLPIKRSEATMRARRQPSSDRAKETFFIPRNAESNDDLFSQIVMLTPAVLNRCLPHASWPWTLGRQAVFVYMGRFEHVGREITRLANTGDMGPLGWLATSESLRILKSPQSVDAAQQGLLYLDAREFLQDIQLLKMDGPLSMEMLQGAGEYLRTLSPEEVNLLVDQLAESVLGNRFPAVAEGLGDVLTSWTEILQSDLQRPADDALRAALVSVWDWRIAPIVERRLRELAGQAAPPVVPQK